MRAYFLTPIPSAYTIYLKQLLLLTLFGIEATGLEIENPFDFDYNDLPLKAIYDTMKRNIEDLISFSFSLRLISDAVDTQYRT